LKTFHENNDCCMINFFLKYKRRGMKKHLYFDVATQIFQRRHLCAV
jgi:hypothetical protein